MAIGMAPVPGADALDRIVQAGRLERPVPVRRARFAPAAIRVSTVVEDRVVEVEEHRARKGHGARVAEIATRR